MLLLYVPYIVGNGLQVFVKNFQNHTSTSSLDLQMSKAFLQGGKSLKHYRNFCAFFPLVNSQESLQ